MRLAAYSVLVLAAVHSSGSPALAQQALRWQTSGVQQVAHEAPAKPRLKPKAPTAFIKPNVTRAIAEVPVAAQALQTPARDAGAAVRQAAVQTAAATPQTINPVTPVCYQNCGPECGCGMPAMTGDPSCGVMDCGEPTCGIAYGEDCGCGDVGCAGSCGGTTGNCVSRGAIPVVFFVPPIQELQFFGGVQAFKGALDATRDRGNFGANLGVNIGGRMSWLPWPGLGYQIGYRAASSQLHGSDIGNTVDPHTQSFFTAGLFHRKQVGLNYGVVYDVLKDERIESADFGQLRGQISIKNPRGHEIGFLFARSLNENTLAGVDYQGVDQYLLFYRVCGQHGGEFRVFGGMDDDSMGIVGGDIDVPLSDRWSLQTGFSYLIPEEEDGGIGAEEEGWNLGMGLVWHYGKRARSGYGSPYRPMFNVADNGTFFVDDRP